MRSKNISNKV